MVITVNKEDNGKTSICNNHALVVFEQGRTEQKRQNQQQKNETKTTTLQQYAPHHLTLNEISPRWSRRLEQCQRKKLPFPLSFTWFRWYNEIRKSSKCIVGEAYGFSSSYTTNCKECDKFSVKFLYSFATYSHSKIQENKDSFVQHWNESHHCNDTLLL
jgi:hypothetical protein